MYNVGIKDLYEGLQSSAQLFVDYSIQRCVIDGWLCDMLLLRPLLLLLLHHGDSTRVRDALASAPSPRPSHAPSGPSCSNAAIALFSTHPASKGARLHAHLHAAHPPDDALICITCHPSCLSRAGTTR